jgi:hypothetical protein
MAFKLSAKYTSGTPVPESPIAAELIKLKADAEPLEPMSELAEAVLSGASSIQSFRDAAKRISAKLS